MARKPPLPPIVSRALARDLDALLESNITGEDARQKLGELLQAALQLEFATIPPYLSASLSLVEDNDAIRDLITRVSQEEMLHMTAVANLMNAIGIPPNIVGAVPRYPFDLTTLEPPLHIVLESFSFSLVEQLFMKIEAPEDPVDFSPDSFLEGVPPRTIGQFYNGIIQLLKGDTIPNLFANAERDAYKQVQVSLRFKPINYLNDLQSADYPLHPDINFLITDRESAVRHLEWIISEGEGAEKFNPLGPEGIPGHYYRFESILESKYLIAEPSVPLGYSYTGGSLPFTEAGVHEFDPNAREEDYRNWPSVEEKMREFNQNYTLMIDSLHAAFNCPDPSREAEAKEAYEDAISAMRDIPEISGAIIRKAKRENIKAGLPFQYKAGAA
jgi:rubrerythrin